jgi:small subunit ribosomal protein S16
MALRIRLKRMGRKKAPHYRIVVAESSSPRDGRFVANLGHYNPRTNPATAVVNQAQARTWLAKGATPTETVQSILKRAGVYEEPTAAEGAIASITETAGRAADAVRGAVATAVGAVTGAAGTVVEAARDAVESLAERIGGEEEGESKPAE